MLLIRIPAKEVANEILEYFKPLLLKEWKLDGY